MSSSAEHAPSPHAALHISAEEQVLRHGIQPIASVDEQALPGVWESNEELNEFLADLWTRPGVTPVETLGRHGHHH